MSEISDIHEPLMRWLDAEGIPYIRARSDKPSTIREGWPDFSLFKDGACLFIEAKAKNTPITEAQKECHRDLTAAGCPVVVARTLAIALEVVQTWRNAGFVRNATLSTPDAPEYAIAQDGTNGDFVYRKGEGGRWRKDRRAVLADLKNFPRIHLRN